MMVSNEYRKFPAEEYDQIEEAGRIALLEGIPAPRIDLREYASTRHSFDLIFQLPNDLRKAVKSNLLDPIKDFFEGRLGTEQIFYDEDSLHTAFFQILTSESEPNYDPTQDPTQEYIRVARLVLATVPPVEISYNRFLRFPGSPGGLMLGGIPADDKINEARGKLKTALDEAGLRQKRPRDVRIAHITLMRDLTPVGVERAKEILDFVIQRDHRVYWSGLLDKVNLQIGNYFMEASTVEVIQSFRLGQPGLES